MTARLLDISRLVSRAGLGALTGIDRVELAYLREFIRRPEPLFGLCRLPRSYAVLNEEALRRLEPYLSGDQPMPKARLTKLLFPKFPAGRQAAIAQVFRASSGVASPRRLKQLIAKHVDARFRYFNVGHANLRAEVFQACGNSRKTVFIHDLIPLSSPEYSTPEVREKMLKAVKVVSEHADDLIYNSSATQSEAQGVFAQFGRVLPGVVSHLGGAATSAIRPASEKPKFHIIGTIEPRKNHRLLLDIWEQFTIDHPAEEIPELHIIGRRGWLNQSVFTTLDVLPMMGKHVFEHGTLSDAETTAMLAESWGLLFPSKAEGFGLPLIEAAALGVPILCGQNAIYHEILGDYPLYLNVDNSYDWSKEILGRAGRTRESEADRQTRAASVKLPDWPSHFDRIFGSVTFPKRENDG